LFFQKSVVPKKFCLPTRPKGPKIFKSNAPNDLENCQSIWCKILAEGTQGIGTDHFSKKCQHFHHMSEQEAPKMKYLPQKPIFSILIFFDFINLALIIIIFLILTFFFDLDPHFQGHFDQFSKNIFSSISHKILWAFSPNLAGLHNTER